MKRDNYLISPNTRFHSLTVISQIEQKSGPTEYKCLCDCGQYINVLGTRLKLNRRKHCGCAYYLNLANKKFHRLLVIERDKNNSKKDRWICRCDCGNQFIAVGAELKRGMTKSCGCFVKEVVAKRFLQNLLNREFGALTVVKRIEKNGEKDGSWECKCSCGNNTMVSGHNLMSGKTASCGKCEHVNNNIIKKYKRNKSRQLESKTKEYSDWRKAVYQRDNYKCVVCKKKRKINAHHLNGWHWCVEERYAISNGVTLCAGVGSCHNKFHSLYGNRRNTLHQFVMFLLEHYNKSLYEIMYGK